MFEDLAGRLIAFTGGVLFSAVICAAIWIRLLMRENAEQRKIQMRTLDLSAQQLAVTKVLNEQEIREHGDKIDRTQRMIQAGTE